MIRALKKTDINCVAKIWLEANLQAHDFIPAEYWKNHFEMVKSMFSEAEIYLYEENTFGEMLGFIGLQKDYIAGIFVCPKEQSRGIGKELLDYVKKIKDHLVLKVYQKNGRALSFYLREDFQIQQESIDEDTGEAEFVMGWEHI